MTIDQITGVIRAILAALGGFILAKGWISVEYWNWLVGGVISIIPVIWTLINNRPAAIAATAQKIEGVTVVTSSSAAASVVNSVAAQKELTP